MKIKTTITILMSLVLAAACAVREPGPAPPSGEPIHDYDIRPLWVAGQVIVKTKPPDPSTPSGGATPATPTAASNAAVAPPAARASLDTIAPVFGAPTVDPAPISGGALLYTFSVPPRSGPVDRDVDDPTIRLVELFRDNPDVEYAHPNFVVELADAPNDPWHIGLPTVPEGQWHYFNNGTGPGESSGGINLPNAWEHTKGKQSIVIAVIDTGIVNLHQDFLPDIGSGAASNIGKGYDMITSVTSAGDNDGRDRNPEDVGDGTSEGECESDASWSGPHSWHGTHVAGIAGAVQTNNAKGIAGTNHHVTVIPVRALGKCGGTTADIIDAIRWAAGVDIGTIPVNPQPANIINMSLRFNVPCTEVEGLQAAIDDVVGIGVTVVAAAGNEYQSAANVSPASCNKVITVAASNRDGMLTAYSNHGALVDIMAPGGDMHAEPWFGVLSTVKDGYMFKDGTSMAAPHVAGVAALMLASKPTLDPHDIEALIKCTAKLVELCPAPCGSGLLDAEGAVLEAISFPVPLNAQCAMAEPQEDAQTEPQEQEITGTGSVTGYGVFLLALVWFCRRRPEG